MSARDVTVSVVVPAWNAGQTIGTTVSALLMQTAAPDEIIIVDDGSTDETIEALAGFGDAIKVIRRPNGGPSAARNTGVREATSDLIAFTDSDCVPERNWLAGLLAGFDTSDSAQPKGVGGVGGLVRGVGGSLTGEYVDVVRLLDPEPDTRGEIPYLITANACFRRSALLEVGLFDEGFRRPGGEEAELGYRLRQAGYRFRLAPSALVHHHHRQSIGGLIRTLMNYGAGAARIASLWPTHRIEHPLRRMLRHLASPRALIRRWRQRTVDYGWRRGLYFALLDHLRHPVFLLGYRLGTRKSANQRHHSLP